MGKNKKNKKLAKKFDKLFGKPDWSIFTLNGKKITAKARLIKVDRFGRYQWLLKTRGGQFIRTIEDMSRSHFIVMRAKTDLSNNANGNKEET